MKIFPFDLKVQPNDCHGLKLGAGHGSLSAKNTQCRIGVGSVNYITPEAISFRGNYIKVQVLQSADQGAHLV